MDTLYELKEMLCDELEEYASKGKLDVGGLDIVDKLAHAVKNIDKILEGGEYSGDYMYNRGGSYRRSYARRRDRMGRYSNGYSMDGAELAEEIRGLMTSAPDEYTRKELEKLTRKLETM